MKYVLNNKEMKALDYITIHDIGIPSMVLMEKAALSVCDEIIKRVEKKDRILVVAGVGNNGGDGIAIARLLSHKEYDVHIYLVGSEENATDEAKSQLMIARNLGIAFDNQINIYEYNIVIDAIFGIGLTRPVTGRFEEVINIINHAQRKVFSVDIPSGIDGDCGKVRNVAIKADYTITFGYPKIGLILYPGCEYAGEIIVADIGFAEQKLNEINPRTFLYDEDDISRLLPKREAYSNKGTFGKVLVIAGSKNMSGASFLSAKAAYSSGAGLVRVLTVEENRTIIQSLLPEAILTTYQPEVLVTETLEQAESNSCNNYFGKVIKEAIEWASVIVLGPGIGVSKASEILFDMVIQYSKVPTILDADAINILAGKEDVMLQNNFILTPHMKEMSRLLHTDMEHMKEIYYQYLSNQKHTIEYTLVLKDPRTLVINKDQTYINISGNNGMATGGSGDVLTGIIAGLLAGGMTIFDAATLGVYIHGLAADEAVKETSTYSLMASDMIHNLSKVFLKRKDN